MLSVLLHALMPMATNEIQPSANQEFERLCMHYSVGIDGMRVEAARVRVRMLGILDCDKKSMDPCDWKGVNCVNEGIKSIFWTNPERTRLVTLNWLPPNLLHILVYRMPILKTLQIRTLPRSLAVCGFVKCNLDGTLDLPALPRGLVEINLNRNSFSGTLAVTDLPQSLVHIEIVHSYIEKLVVSQLPRSLESMYVHSWQENFTVEFPESEVDHRLRIAVHPGFSARFKEYLNLCE